MADLPPLRAFDLASRIRRDGKIAARAAAAVEQQPRNQPGQNQHALQIRLHGWRTIPLTDPTLLQRRSQPIQFLQVQPVVRKPFVQFRQQATRLVRVLVAQGSNGEQ